MGVNTATHGHMNAMIGSIQYRPLWNACDATLPEGHKPTGNRPTTTEVPDHYNKNNRIKAKPKTREEGTRGRGKEEIGNRKGKWRQELVGEKRSGRRESRNRKK